jgi:hypothetical protein
MEVVRLSTLPTGRLYPLGDTLVLVFVAGCVDLKARVGPEGLCQAESQMTPSRIESATFRCMEDNTDCIIRCR